MYSLKYKISLCTCPSAFVNLLLNLNSFFCIFQFPKWSQIYVFTFLLFPLYKNKTFILPPCLTKFMYCLPSWPPAWLIFCTARRHYLPVFTSLPNQLNVPLDVFLPYHLTNFMHRSTNFMYFLTSLHPRLTYFMYLDILITLLASFFNLLKKLEIWNNNLFKKMCFLLLRSV